jgi:hypothetical protein
MRGETFGCDATQRHASVGTCGSQRKFVKVFVQIALGVAAHRFVSLASLLS